MVHCTKKGRDSMELRHWAAQGVDIVDAATTHIADDVVIASGTTILPQTILGAGTRIGAGCTIGPMAHIKNTVVGDDCTIECSQLEDSRLGNHCTVGPYAHVRMGCTIGDGVRIGSFVQLKNTALGNGSAVPHLAYLGDCTVGEGTNISCLVTTANFDGVGKHPTAIGDNAFIGCHSTLVAPVTIGDGAWTAAGSVITEDIPPDGLGIARARQVNKPNWAAAHIKRVKDEING